MTMTEGTAPTPPSAIPVDLNPSHTLYGFETDIWVDQPIPIGSVDWFSRQERYRRNANEQAYKQYGHPTNWNRYVQLGLFVFEDCFECDKVWAAIKTDPLMVHRAIWYNFMGHVDRELQVPVKLNAWATNISQPYLAYHDPTTLHATNTVELSWKEMHFFKKDEMVLDDVQEWIPVTGRRRSKSPPKQEYTENETTTSKCEGSFAPGFNFPPEDLPRNYRPMDNNFLLKGCSSPNPEINTDAKDQQESIMKSGKMTRDKKMNEEEETKRRHKLTVEAKQNENRHKSKNHSNQSDEKVEVTPSIVPRAKTSDSKQDMSETATSTHQGTKPINGSRTSVHQNVPTNDGTHRITIRWTPPESIHVYEKDKNKMNEDIHSLVNDMFPEATGVLYRWESEDLVLSNSVQSLSRQELRDYISPKVTLISPRSQMIFGIRFGFKGNPLAWRRSEEMKAICRRYRLDVSISNSQSTSGNMVTAGYVLLKAPNTTQITWYTKYLRSILPASTPYFDIVRNKKSPMDQLIPHLCIQCGEKHVTPLCKALLPVLTGRGSALFLPRYAFSTMSSEQVRSHFEFHEKWSKSLKAITMSPQINHLDQVRTEYNDDGTTTERSTREWAASIKEEDGITPALCDVVNGTNDQHSYLLSPTHFYSQAQSHWRMYKARLYPPSHRETRFRDNLPGLPDVITIQSEIQSNVSFLEQMSLKQAWKNDMEKGNKAPNITNDKAGNLTSRNQQVQRQAWPTPSETTEVTSHPNSSVRSYQSGHDNDSTSIHDSMNFAEDRSTGSTRSSTQASRNTMNTRFHEIDAILKRDQKAMQASSKKTSDRLSLLERQFGRIDDLDTKLSSVQTSIENTNKDTARNQQQMANTITEMQRDTAQQFDEVRSNVLETRVSQQMMSATLLDLRDQFEQLSEFMVTMGHKLDIVMTVNNDQASPAADAIPRKYKRTQKEASSGEEAPLKLHSKNTPSNSVQSPNKKKSRQIKMESPGDKLHSDLEEMSLGTEESDPKDDMSRMNVNNANNRHISSRVQIEGSLLDDSLEDISTNGSYARSGRSIQYQLRSRGRRF
ncbi:hypothetical protein MHU86_15926 [Fragilaria crotonensis]|nr:hypothetical protein MHU86_15926 [Fragilaria crotonensis]